MSGPGRGAARRAGPEKTVPSDLKGTVAPCTRSSLPTRTDAQMPKERKPRQSIPEAWGGYLSEFEWSHWTTLTFRPYVRPESPGLAPPAAPRVRPGPPPDFARRAFNGFIAHLRFQAHQPLAWFRGDELGERLGRLHLHALIDGTDGLLPSTLAATWPYGFSRIEVYDPALGATHYLTKYAVKTLASYDLGGPLRRRGEGTPRLEGM